MALQGNLDPVVLIAGGDVVGTIKKGIIDPQGVADGAVFVRLMLAALFAAALWINLATLVSAPVSTTHAIVGDVLGAGVAAAGAEDLAGLAAVTVNGDPF